MKNNWSLTLCNTKTFIPTCLILETDSSHQFDHLGGWGPKFSKLSILYHRPDTCATEDEDEVS